MAATDLQRSVTDARVAGVCGGIAERYHIDPLLVRVVAVIIALSSGVGFVLYGAAWLLLPRGAEQPALVRAFPTVDRVRSRTWIALVVVAATVVMVVVGSVFDVSLMPTMVVLGILYASQLRPGSKVPASSVRPGPGPVPAAPQPTWPLLPSVAGDMFISTPAGRWRPTNRWGQPLSVSECATYFSVPDPAGLYGRRPAAGPLQRSRILAIVSGLAIAAFFAMLSLLGAFVRVEPVTYLAAGLVLVGAALVVGAFVGRPRGFVAIATALILIAGITTMDASDASAPAVASQSPATSEELASDVSVAGNDYTLDLSGMEATQDAAVAIHMTKGNVVVMLPSDSAVTISWNVVGGRVTLPDGSEGPASGGISLPASTRGPATTISVDVLWGDLVIT